MIKANINAICSKRSPLQIAVIYQYWDLVEYYFGQGANEKFIADGYWNLLHLIACSDNVELAKKWISLFDVNTKNDEKRTPVNYAAQNGSEKMFNFLIQQRADWKLQYKIRMMNL